MTSADDSAIFWFFITAYACLVVAYFVWVYYELHKDD